MSTAGGRPDLGWPGIAFLFPGEGSVQPGAGRPWRDHPSWTVVERLSHQIDVDLADLLLHAPAEQLRPVESANHAAVALGVLLWDALARSEVRPSLCLGHGVGEYVALTAGGALGLDALAAVVAARGTALAEVAERRPGTSSSVVGLDQDHVHGPCTMAAGQVWVTQHNAVRRVPTVDLAVPDDLDFVDIVVRRQRQPQRPEPAGEVLTVAERLVVSPVAGRFVASGPVFSEAGVGTEVRAGQRFGRVGESDVRSMFSGQLMGLLARPGERVTVGQPIAWIRT